MSGSFGLKSPSEEEFKDAPMPDPPQSPTPGPSGSVPQQPPPIITDPMQAQLIELLRAMTHRDPQPRRKPKAPDAETFSGDRTKFAEFETQVRLKLMSDADIYTTD
jgi:hypothetical protein